MGIKTELPWLPELKPGWKQSRLKDIILDMHSGGTPDSKVSEYYCDWEDTDRGVPWCSISDIPKGSHTLEKTLRRITDEGMKNKKLRKVPKGTLLYSIYASLGEVCITGIETTINQAILAIYENKKIIDQSYLYYYLLSLRENITYFANTNIQNNLNGEIVGNLIVVYPESIDEQRKIAKDLKKKDDLIEGILNSLKEKESLIENLRKSVFIDMKTNKDSNVKWLQKRVKDMFFVKRGRVIGKVDLIENGKYPVYSSQTESDGVIGFIDTYDFDGEYLTWTTDGIYAGTVFKRTGKFNCTNVCGSLKIKPEFNSIDFDFLFFTIRESARLAKRDDINGGKLMSNEMEEIIIDYPQDLKVQQKIALALKTKYDLIDQLEESVRVKLNLLKSFKKATLIKELG